MSLFTFYDELKARLSLKSPEFFHKLRAIYVKITIIAGIIAGLSVVELQFYSEMLPEAWVKGLFVVATWISTMAAKAAAFDTKLAVANTEKLAEKKSEVIEKKIEDKANDVSENK